MNESSEVGICEPLLKLATKTCKIIHSLEGSIN